MTLPCCELVARARFEPSLELGGRIVTSSGKVKSRQAAEITLRYLRRSEYGGVLILESNIEKGFGLGSSATDVVATIRAVADAFEVYLPPEVVASLAVEAERASDAIMFDDSCVIV